MNPPRQPDIRDLLLTEIRDALFEILKVVQRIKPKKKRVKQGGLWKSVPDRVEKPYDRAGKEWEERKRQNEAELAAERKAREVKAGVVVSAAARAAAEKIASKSREALG